MSMYSDIEWCDCTWNPATGCTKVSKACKICYMFGSIPYLQGLNNPRYTNGADPTMHWDLVDTPKTWKKGKNIFVCSMSDLFHEDYPIEFIQSVFETMNTTPRHTYRVLTKRPERLKEIADELKFTDNIWLGVSVEDREVYNRIDILRKINHKNRWLSVEPLLESVSDIDLTDIKWIVVGGESGSGARPMNIEWVREVRDKCLKEDKYFFFKQFGIKSNNPDMFDSTMTKHIMEESYDENLDCIIKKVKNPLYAKGGCVLDGKLYREFPPN